MRRLTEVISLSGLKKIGLMYEKPKYYKALVLKYLNDKAKHIQKMNEIGRDTEALEFQFLEALRIAKKLEIVWTGKMKF